MLHQNNSKGNVESTLFRTVLSRAIKISIIFSLKSLLSLVKMEKSSKKEEKKRLHTCHVANTLHHFSIIFTLKIMESLLIAWDKPVLNKSDSSLSLELFWYNIIGYQRMFYHTMWCPSTPLCVYSLFNFQYYVMSFSILS